MSREESKACAGGSCCGGSSRREFLKQSGLAAIAAATAPVMAGPFEPADTADHFVPIDKKLSPEWVKKLFERGARQVYAADDLRMIGMPVCGITTGQIYLGGDGRLLHWDIHNGNANTGYGDKNYSAPPPASPIEQGFSLAVTADGKTTTRTLDRAGFPGVRFCGEYPMAWVDYEDPAFPIATTMEAFSPFCPLNEADSALPVTVLRFTLRNTGNAAIEATLRGVLENAVARYSASSFFGVRQNSVLREPGWTMVSSSARPAPPPADAREPIVIETFEGPDYGKWTVEGAAFGKAPARGTLPNQQEVSGFAGQGLINTFLGGDQPQGKLTSPPFKIDRRFLCFLIGGGNEAKRTCMNLLVDGKIVRSVTGRDNEKLEPRFWDVREFAGKEAQLQIVDAASGAWGHINVDQIEQRDVPAAGATGPLEKQADFGTMGLAVLEKDQVLADPGYKADAPAGDRPPVAEAALESRLVGSLARTVKLAAGQSQAITFIVAWHFPLRPDRGNRYAVPFKDAADVVRHVAANFQKLYGQTKLWHKTWYEDSTLPRWLLDRVFSTVSTLATGTCQWWANGRFWAWEGVGCCHGTCAHVWNYAHSLARIFPALEKSARTMQDLEPSAGFDEKTGAVRFRGEGWALWAGDSQGGTALKCLREHHMSADDAFLKQYWPRIRKTIQFLIDQDADGDGLIEGKQHNTYDIDFYGPNTMVGSLYLGALRAGEEMAREIGDTEFAAACRKILDAGVQSTQKRLWNGEYFIQVVDLKQHPKHQYADGCLSDQLFGQGWAHQVGLGDIYPKEQMRSALKAIWTYNWAPDVGPQNQNHPPQRWFARPGEAGLFTCTWPKSKHLGPESVLYRDEVWTGIEYQVAGHMVWEGMLTEALAICRAIHDRYHPAKHNPWNEIECGDHYARGMASHGVYLALCGFDCHGPKGHIGFAPKLTPENFAGAFTAAEGWGTYAQKIAGNALQASIAVRYGRLRLRSLSVALPADTRPAKATVKLGDKDIPADLQVAAGKATLRFSNDVVVGTGEELKISL